MMSSQGIAHIEDYTLLYHAEKALSSYLRQNNKT